jgi:hypothetical protein
MEGSITVISFATGRPIAKWRLPGGGSPDMGGLSANGKVLWLSGRYNGVVYAISTRSGRLLHEIKVGEGPHGLCVWRSPAATRSATRASCASRQTFSGRQREGLRAGVDPEGPQNPYMCVAASPPHSSYGAKNSRTSSSSARACGSPPLSSRPTSLSKPTSPAGT